MPPVPLLLGYGHGLLKETLIPKRIKGTALINYTIFITHHFCTYNYVLLFRGSMELLLNDLLIRQISVEAKLNGTWINWPMRYSKHA